VEDFGYAKDEMAVRDGLEYFLAEPLPEFHHTFLMTRWAEMPSLTRECKQIFMTTIATPDTCKAMMQDTAIKISINDLSYIGAKKSISFVKTVIVNLLKLFKMILNALVVRCVLGIALSVYRLRHELSHP